jgi:hypothetical protein
MHTLTGACAVSKEDAMTDADLDAEHDAIVLEHAALSAEHARIEHDGSDVRGQLEYSRKLRDHVDRQRSLIAALRVRQRRRDLS